MSHLDNRSQKYVDLYQLRQASTASTLHSNLAQPIVAAKNFSAAIMSLEGDDANLQEARELAGIILEMTDQAYTVAYDLMRQSEPDLESDVDESIQSTIENYGALLRLSARGITLKVEADITPISIDNFLQVIILDWVKAVLIYLSRQTQTSFVNVELTSSDSGLCLEIKPNSVLTSEQLDAEIALATICKQLQVLEGNFLLTQLNDQSCLQMVIPPCEMLAVNQEGCVK